MHGIGARDALTALVTERRRIDAGEEVFAGAEQARADRDMQLVDKSGLEVLPDRGYSAAEPNVLTIGRVDCHLQRRVDSACDEMEACAAIHDDRFSGMMSEHEDRRVEGRIGAPPAGPCFVGPGSPDRAEHIAADDPRSYVGESTRYEVVIDATRTAFFSHHLLKGTSWEHPVVQCVTAEAKRVVEILIGTGAVSVNGYCKVMDTKSCHRMIFSGRAIARSNPTRL